eukprot:4757952-Alexandrium_andersonii.AAC.1
MSASLVGSEMCIRDSRRTPCPPRAPTDGTLPRPMRGTSHGCDARLAVSYTHLTLPTICSV